MPEPSGETYADHAGMEELSATLAMGATVLDDTGADAPPAPDAGVSTPLVGDLLAGLSAVVGDLVTAVDVTATGVRASDKTIEAADRGGAQQLGVFGE